VLPEVIDGLDDRAFTMVIEDLDDGAFTMAMSTSTGPSPW
jgi:hypothetical protein